MTTRQPPSNPFQATAMVLPPTLRVPTIHGEKLVLNEQTKALEAVRTRPDRRLMIAVRTGPPPGRWYYGATRDEVLFEWIRGEHPEHLPAASRALNSGAKKPRTISDLIDAYLPALDRMVTAQAKTSTTQRSEESVIRRLIANAVVTGVDGRPRPLTTIGVEELTPGMIDELAHWCQSVKGLSSSQAAQARNAVGSMYKWARKKQRWTSNNPISDSSNVLVKTERVRDDEIPTVEQIHHLLDVTKGDWFRPIIALACTTGMRGGEIAATSDDHLFAPDDDPDGVPNRLYVASQAQLIRLEALLSIGREKTVRHEESDPKRRKRRWVSLTRATGLALVDAMDYRDSLAPKRPNWDPQWASFLFRQPRAPDGAPLPVDEIGGLWSKRLEKAGLPHWRFHSTRHFAVSMWIAAGHKTWVIARRVGHANDKLIQERYGHLLDKFDAESAQAMERLFADFLPATMVDPDAGDPDAGDPDAGL